MHAHAADVAAAHFVVQIPCWLYAVTFSIPAGGLVLAVYRSPAVRDGDPIFRPVAEFISAERFDLVDERVQEDDEMMMGRGKLSVYRKVG